MSKTKLLPCPFCGSEVYIEDLGVEKGDHYYMMQCKNEDCDAATCFGEKNKEKFIKAWNTRKPMERIVERLEEEWNLADKEQSRCVSEKSLQYERAKGYANGVWNAIEIVRQVE